MNDNIFIENVRKAIQIVIFNHLRSTELDSQLNRRLFEKSNFFHDTRQRSISIKSTYIVNWTVNVSRFRHDVKIFVLNIRHLLKFIDESIDTTSQTFLSDSSTNSNFQLKAFKSDRRQHFSSKKEDNRRKLFESTDTSRRFNTIFDNIDTIDIIDVTEIIDTTAEKDIYHHFIELDLSANFSMFDNADNIDNTDQSQQFDVNIQRLLNVVVNRAMNVYVRRNSFQQNSLDSLDSSKAQSIVDVVDDENDTSLWRSEKLDFFDFHFSAFYDSDSMIKNDKDFYYRNVHFFCERIRDLIIIKDDDVVRINLNTCFRDTALIWYTIELKSLKRFDFRNLDVDESWIKKLKQRFKSNHVVVINFLISKRFIIVDVRNDREFFNYIQ